ncbi:MAG: hypothetical protein IIA41_12270 [SAR324 cluster bacterium]|nr:hypothetical protein [SAR324 cluster bacterium]
MDVLFRTGLALLLGFAWLGALSAAGEQNGRRPESPIADGVLPVQNAESEDDDACNLRYNLQVFKSSGWSFFLRGLDARNGSIVVKLAFKNNTRTGLIALAPGVQKHTALIDDATMTPYPVEEIEGIGVELQKVARRKYEIAYFTFPYPEKARTVRFTSTWLAPIMRGAATKIKVDFPIEIPARDACKV